MAVPTSVSDLDAVASNNSPSGSEPIGTNLDNYLRAHAAIIKQVSNSISDGSKAGSFTTLSASGIIAARSGLSAAAPDYTFSADGSMGMFRLPGVLGFSTGGVERMRIDASGNVGIGATSPRGRLDVSGAQNLSWVGGGSTTALVTLGTQGSGSSLFVNTPSVNQNNASGLAIDGSYPAGTEVIGRSIINIKACGVNFNNSGYGSELAFHTSSGTTLSERARIDASGNLLVGKTSVTANGGDLQVSKGITFPATRVACSDANTLDDYEEGTFTPTIAGASTAGVGTYSVQTGRYTKIGRLVTINIGLVWSAHTGTGNMRISGIPFSAGGAGTNAWYAGLECSNMTFPASTIPSVYIAGGGTQLVVCSQAVGSGTNTALAMDTAASIYLSLTYEAA